MTSALDGNDALFVTKVTKNDNSTYTLYGVVYTCNKNAHPEFKIPNSWTVSNDYRKITVSSNTTCWTGYPEEEITTVGKYFNNYKEAEIDNLQQSNDINTYKFVFENGKLIDYCTSI